jgi:hypothetical protein
MIKMGALMPDAIIERHVTRPISQPDQLLARIFAWSVSVTSADATALTVFKMNVVIIFRAAEPTIQPMKRTRERTSTERSMRRVSSELMGPSEAN